MSLARVQATPKGTGGPPTTCTFASAPTVGNGIVVLISGYNGTAVTAVSDNRGNSYILADVRVQSIQVAAVYYCPAITTTGTPFQVSVTLTGGSPTIVAVEVSGVGAGLAVDKSVTNFGTGAITPTTGTTTPLAGAEAFLAAAIQTTAGFTSFVVASATPSWIQEYESIPFSNPSGEGDDRIVTSAGGTTQSCSWTLNAGAEYAAVLVAFGSGGGGGGGGGGSRARRRRAHAV